MSRPLARPARRVVALFFLTIIGGSAIAAHRAAIRPPPEAVPGIGQAFPRLGLPLATDRRRTWRIDSVAPARALVLYVSDSCSHCTAELRAWRDAAAAQRHRPPIIVVRLASNPTVPSSRAPFTDREVLDTSGVLGRALGIRAVPAWFDVRRGRIHRMHVGRTTADGLMRLFTPDPSAPR